MTTSFGGIASGWGRDLNVCAQNLGKVKFLASRGERTAANTLFAEILTDLTALKLTLNNATEQKDLNVEPTLDDPNL